MFYIAREIEDRVRGVSKFEYKVPEDLKRPNYIAEKAIKLTEELNSNEIIVFTESGFTARVLSSFLPKKKIIAITQSKTVIRQLSMVRGITALSVDSGKAIPGDRDDFVSFIVKTLEANDIETNKESVILKISDKSKRSKGFIEIVSL
jgi:pyruvate kinase